MRVQMAPVDIACGEIIQGMGKSWKGLPVLYVDIAKMLIFLDAKIEEIDAKMPIRAKSSGPSILKTLHPGKRAKTISLYVQPRPSTAQMGSPDSMVEILTAAGMCVLGTITEVSSGVQVMDRNSLLQDKKKPRGFSLGGNRKMLTSNGSTEKPRQAALWHGID